jgi:hypothetical protein
MRRPLALTDHQLQLVQRAARSLPVAQRDQFLQAVAAQLVGTPAETLRLIGRSRSFCVIAHRKEKCDD